MATVITFVSEKGGTGKTTSIQAIATYLHYAKEFKIALLDCDNYQASSSKDRTNQLFKLEQLGEKTDAKKFFNQIITSKPLYPIIKVAENEFVSTLNSITDQYDIVFVDMPGFINPELLRTVIPLSDFAFVPTHVDERTVPATVDFGRLLMILKEDPNSLLQEIRFYYSKYSTSKLQAEFIANKQFIESRTGVKFMENQFYEKTELVKGNFSSVLPYKGSDEDGHFLYKFIIEFLTIITDNE